ncbi:MAG: SUMF1/EgtB/PvdO family nonheme iron enzyme [Deltaproteobacteria bacterium]|nr:SUMF1/EgtB/PvdO family nonheme iron enzyme [Deltaproteobacteria bacterium]
MLLLFVACSTNDSPPESEPWAQGRFGESRSTQAEPRTKAIQDRAETPRVAAKDGDARPEVPVDEALKLAPCPRDMVLIGRFCIDRHEAHLRVITPEGVGPIHPHYERPASGVSYRAVSTKGVFPQGYISRVEAQAACQQAGKRLCSRGEWMLACRGTKAAPTGKARARPCNNGKTHLLTQRFGGGYDYERHFNSPELNQTPGFLAKTGAFSDCLSELGVHDMVGNLHEWVSDTVTQSFLTQFQAEVGRQYQHKQVGNGVFMGGFYSTTGELGPGCLFTTVAHDANYHDYTTGFRCCRAKGRPGR